MLFRQASWVGVSLLVVVSSFSRSAALLFVLNRSMQVMVTFSTPGHSCRVITDRSEVMKAVLTMPVDSMVRTASDADMTALMDACQQHNSVGSPPGGSGGFRYPGTKWCGPGNAARSYEDLGVLTDVDRCCRDHDSCPVSILAGKCNDNGVCNKTPYTSSECKCDKQFQDCLHRVRTPTADTIGVLTFNIGRVMCFTDDPLCGKMAGACPLRTMPYYKTSNELRNLKILISKLIRGFVKLKHAILFNRE